MQLQSVKHKSILSAPTNKSWLIHPFWASHSPLFPFSICSFVVLYQAGLTKRVCGTDSASLFVAISGINTQLLMQIPYRGFPSHSSFQNTKNNNLVSLLRKQTGLYLTEFWSLLSLYVDCWLCSGDLAPQKSSVWQEASQCFPRTEPLLLRRPPWSPSATVFTPISQATAISVTVTDAGSSGLLTLWSHLK